MKKIIGLVLIVLSLALGYMGINKVSNSESSVNILGIELSAADQDARTEGFVYLGLAVVVFIGGVSLAGKKD